MNSSTWSITLKYDIFSLLQGSMPSLVSFIDYRIENIESAEVRGNFGTSQRKQITLVDGDGATLKFFLWGEQILLANLFRWIFTLSNLWSWVILFLCVDNIHHFGGLQSRKHACPGQTIHCKFCRVWYSNKRGILPWIWKCNTIIFGALHSTWRTGDLMDFCMTLL